jgi:hypothetical protein
MKPFRACTILSIAALCALLSFSPRKAYADALLYMQITGVQGTAYGGEDVYPYYGTANGKPVTLMCISFTADMSLGETWEAEEEYIPSSSSFEEAAWLFNDANAAVNGTFPYSSYNSSAQIADQWAAWELFSGSAYGTAPPLAATQMAAAVASYASEPDSFYQGFILYAPVPGSQNENDTAQFFLGNRDETPSITPDPYSPGPGSAPEPGSLILLGTGLAGLAASLYRRRRSAGKSLAKSLS